MGTVGPTCCVKGAMSTGDRVLLQVVEVGCCEGVKCATPEEVAPAVEGEDVGHAPVGVGGEVEGVGHAMLGATAGVKVGVSKENGGVWGRRVLSLSQPSSLSSL